MLIMAVDLNQLAPHRRAVDDNRRWADFDHRPDDIFVCTPAKCGTTWTQTIVASLLWPAGNQPAPVGQLSPWIEANFMPADVMHDQLRAQTHRRFMKTHTPAEGIPWYEDAKYIFVARDGRDAFMSMCNHMERMSKDLKNSLNAKVQDEDDIALLPDWNGDIHAAFKDWMSTMEHLQHVASFWQRRKQANVLLVHYNDLKQDLSGEMRRIADFLNIEVPDSLWPQTVERCTFEAMRNDTERMGNFDAFDGGLKGFIFKGTNGRWRDVLTTQELAEYGTSVEREMSSEASQWSANGISALVGAAHP
jgi:aryl sulfotransferase